MSLTAAISTYLESVQREFATGIAIEHAYRPALEKLLESVEDALNAVNDPKRSDVGAPDFVVLRGRVPIGIAEAKDLDVDLNRVEKSEQMARYLKIGNVILTDYLEFRWYVDGEKRQTARIASISKKKIQPDTAQFDELEHLLRGFVMQTTPTIRSSRELAERMAGYTQEIRNLIAADLSSDSPSSQLVGQMEAFKKTLLPDLNIPAFADMYAQTIAYGLFAARVNYTGKAGSFSREVAARAIPQTNPFLRNLFHTMEFDLGERVNWLVDGLADLLAHADTDDILKDFGKKTRQDDPVVHFYETFLAAYDPAMRDQRGVYYTPEPVVSYIVRSVDHILKTTFNRPDGLADRGTMILDPATGTGTFLYFVIRHIYEQIVEIGGQKGTWNAYVRDHLLPRLFGFELLVAPYTVAHMKLGLELRETGYDFADGKRLGVYLTNTLEENMKQPGLPMAEYISAEANAATDIKRAKPIMVVLGNPPYSGHSANKGDWIGGLVRDYYKLDGKPLGERNPKWLQDDYVKFIRFGQWRIDATGVGVLAFVTNHGYLDNPTFRGMRQQLMGTFDEIYVLNLHGNAKKKETAPDGGKDDNVFDIQQGVAIGLLVKRSPHPPDAAQMQSSPPKSPSPLRSEGDLNDSPFDSPSLRGTSGEGAGGEEARVYHADLYGLRKDKYAALLDGDLATTNWQKLTPQAPYYLFTPINLDLGKEYEAGWKVTDVFSVNGWGIATRKDYLLVDFSKENMVKRFKDIRSLSPEDAIKKYSIKPSPHWNFTQAHSKLAKDTENHVKPVLFRPFDVRYVYYEKVMIERGDHRYDLMSHMFDQNICLISVRRSEGTGIPEHFYCTNEMSVLHSTSSKEGNFVFPLYLYTAKAEGQLFALEDDGSAWALSDKGRRPNLNPAFVKALEAKLGLAFRTEGAAFNPTPLPPPHSQARGEGEFSAGRDQSPLSMNAVKWGGDLGVGSTSAGWFGPEDVFHYAYAVFHSPEYRERYAEFLKIDFPRLPLTSDVELFKTLCGYGAQLVALHLMKHPALMKLITKYPEAGDNVVGNGYPKFEVGKLSPPPNPLLISQAHGEGESSAHGGNFSPLPEFGEGSGVGSVYINKTQYFDGVPEAVWDFHVGGYQVLEKWLKDRRGRTLSYDDLLHYQRIVVALGETIRLMDAIDDAIPAFPLV